MQKTFAASIKLALYRGLFGATGGFLGFGALAAFLWFSGREVLAGRLSVGMIFAFQKTHSFDSRKKTAHCPPIGAIEIYRLFSILCRFVAALLAGAVFSPALTLLS